jgi:hypothetical protein
MKRKTPVFSIQKAFSDLQNEMNQCLIADGNVEHPVAKGTLTEDRWVNFLKTYIPERYKADKAFVIDSDGNISEEIDIVIYDRQYSPFIFKRNNTKYIPAESVYAVFEVKPTMNKTNILYAAKKISSVRKLKRTSAKIPYVEGKYKPKKLFKILSGILTIKSGWQNPFNKHFYSVISELNSDEQIDIGCILKTGAFEINYKEIATVSKEKSLVSFFMILLIKLQSMGTCPAMDIKKYCRNI